jgi:hypothetical protein
MKKRIVCVELIVCRQNETWYKDYEFVETYYPEDPSIGQDALLKFSESLEESEIEYVGVFDIRVAEPEPYMEDSCQDDDISCPKCEHFETCFQGLTEN